MKKLSLIASSLLVLAFNSCSSDGDSTAGSAVGDTNEVFFDNPNAEDVNTTDSAPFTLDGIKMNIAGEGDFTFYFQRTSGDASNGTEVGFCPAFAVTTETLAIPLSSGSNIEYDLPDFVSDITYEYQRVSDSTGIITIQGNGVGDGGNSAGTDDTNIDIFVTQAGNTTTGTSKFIANLSVNFGATSGIVDTLSINTVLLQGTSDPFTQSISYSVTSAQNGASISLQNDNPLTTGYTANDASSVARVLPSPLFPAALSNAVELEMNFNPNTITAGSGFTNVSKYVINNVASTPIGFPDGTDQGVSNLTIFNNNNIAITGDSTATPPRTYVISNYAWETDNNSTNVVRLTLIITENSTTRTEVYLLDFNTNNSGNFSQTQPANGIQGIFELPFLSITDES